MKQREIVKGIEIPIVANYVLDPDVYYGRDFTGIYFETEDDQFGRITFNNLDSIKICRGEIFPYEYDWKDFSKEVWIYKIENSQWLTERYQYEKDNYGNSYEFGGNVDEMLTDFNHYVFSFHDQFIEVIARGFWHEKSENSLFNTKLQNGHPSLPLEKIDFKQFETSGIKYEVIFNTIPIDLLIKNTHYCQQKLIDISIELENEYSILFTLIIMQRQGNLISVLRNFFGKSILEKDDILKLDDIKPLIEKEIFEISERRKHMRRK